MSITENINGSPLFLKDSAWASKFFGGQSMLNAPKRKFTFFCGFIGNSDAMKTVPGGEQLFSNLLSPSYVFLVKSATPPGWKMDTAVLDQYNKKRVVQSRINYDPIDIRFHDDVDNKMVQLIDSYTKFYYGDSFNNEYADWSLDTTKAFKNEGSWGIKANEHKYFFQAIWMAWVNSGTLTYAVMRNPMITDIKMDQLDYADNAPMEISMSFDYEGVVFKDMNVPISTETSSLSEEAALVRNLILDTEDVGQFFTGPHPTEAAPGRTNRSPGLGELFNAGSTFFGKYNGKPSLKDAIGDFVLKPIVGSLGTSLNSWGNFNFGGTGGAGGGGLFGNISNTIGNAAKYLNSGSIVRDTFKSSVSGSSLASRANTQFLKATQSFGKFF